MKKTWMIYGHKIKIVKRKRLKHPATGEPCLGLYDHDKGVMYIQAGLDPKTEWHTITHELVHAMQFRLGYFQTGMSLDFLEQMAETFGNMIAENFKWTK